MRLSGFDGGGWQLKVFGCWRGRRSLELARKLAGNKPELAGPAAAVRKEKREREKVFWIELCVFRLINSFD